MMKYSEMAEAIDDAEVQIRLADTFVAQMAKFICWRLRGGNVSGRVLAALKRELRDFNAHTKQWKD